MQLLHLDSSVLGTASVSRHLSAELVARQRALHPEIRVTSRDLSVDPALHLSGAHMAAFQGAATDDAIITADLLKGNAYMDELFASDVLVIGAPMYNLSIPTPLKAWIDRIAVAGKTFRYTATGPEGLLKNKRPSLHRRAAVCIRLGARAPRSSTRRATSSACWRSWE